MQLLSCKSGTIPADISRNCELYVFYHSRNQYHQVFIDCQLTFYPQIKEVCKRVSQKTKALLRIRGYLNQSQTEVLINSYILSAFNYCPLVWMFCSKKAHDLINATYRRTLCAKLNIFSVP